MKAAGLEVVHTKYINPIGAIGWWVNAKIIRPKGLSVPLVNRQIIIYDRFVQPVSQLLDPLTRRFFGQSLWAVGRRSVS